MKKGIITLLAIFSVMVVTAQYYYIPASINPGGNPGNLNNDVEQPYNNGLPASWTIIDPLDGSPAWTNIQTIPFNFVFNGTTFTQYKVSNTGVLTFSTGATTVPSTSNNVIPNATIPNNSIMIWGLNYTGGQCNDRIVNKTFGTFGSRQHWIQFSSYNISVSASQCWTYWSIVLEEGTNNIYIVDQRCSTKGSCQPTVTVGVQMNASSATMVASSPNLGTLAGTSKTAVDNEYYTFIQGSAPTKDLSVSWLQMTPFLIFNTAPFEIKGQCKNYTGIPVTSYDINFQVDNGPVMTAHMTGAAYDIPAYGTEWFIHDSSWTPDTLGYYNIKIWADNINGGNDQNHSNDTMKKLIEISTAFISKLALFEEFTSSTCVDCNQANSTLGSVLNNNQGEYTLIKYPMNYPGSGDPYYTNECETRKTYYSVDSLPDMIVNGDIIVDPLYFDTTQFNLLWDKAYMTFSPTHTIIGNKITVSASVLPFQDFVQGTLMLRFALVEKQTTGNVGTNGQTVFYNTFKKFIPNSTGTNLGSLQQAVFKTVTKSYTFPASNTIENWNNLEVVVFVQDDATHEILQSAYSSLQGSIDDNDSKDALISIVPNPAKNHTTLHYYMYEQGPVNLTVYNLSGQEVYNQNYQNQPQGLFSETINLEGFDAGLYMIRIQCGSHLSTAKLQVW